MRSEKIKGNKYQLAGIGVFQKGEKLEVYAEFCPAEEKLDRVFAAQVKRTLIGERPEGGVVGSVLDTPQRIRLSLRDFGEPSYSRLGAEITKDLGRKNMSHIFSRMLDMHRAVEQHGSYALLPLTAMAALPDNGVQPDKGRREKVLDVIGKLKNGGFGERSKRHLYHAFMEAAGDGNAEELARYIEKNVDINYQEPRTLATALHTAASHQARDTVRVLVATGKCNYLLRDVWGRLASDLAKGDPACARLLRIKEGQQVRTLQAASIAPVVELPAGKIVSVQYIERYKR